MLRESSMPYSSLPQEEGEQTYVTTRTSGPAKQNTSTKSRIASITLILLLICGVPLMILAPLALTRGNGHSETSVTLPHISGQDNDDSLSKNNQSILINTLPTPTPHVAIPFPVIKNITFKPLIPAPPPTTTTTTTTTTTSTTTTTKAPTTTTTTTTTTPAPVTTRPIIVIPTAFVPKPSVEGGIKGLGENQTGDEIGTTDMPESQKVPDGGLGSGEDSDGIDNTSQTFRGMVTNLMSKHEWWTVVGLAVVVALAMATVIIAITWIVHSRFASRRRRTNLEKVITDLQSRDKVVLLNSEDSEDEA